MSKITKIAFSLGLVLTSLGCQADLNTIEQADSYQSLAKNNVSTLKPATLSIWNQHLKEVKNEGSIQKGCQPFYTLAKGQTKGNVLLYHGYSACPQQYEELAQVLNNRGYNVFVPLLPGHGKEPIRENGKVIDQGLKLPDVKSTVVYENFAKSMGALLKEEQGTKVVGGLSVGGVVAAKTMLTNPDVYDKGLFMAPFFNSATPLNLVLPVLGAVIPNKSHSWGEECENERKLGRAGYCNFKLTNVAAVRKFGVDTLKEVGKIKKPVQIIGVEKDDAASNGAIAEASKRIALSQGCLFEKGAKHSMFSRQDNVGVDMFWLEPLKQQMADFVDNSKTFDVVGQSEHGLGLCRSR